MFPGCSFIYRTFLGTIWANGTYWDQVSLLPSLVTEMGISCSMGCWCSFGNLVLIIWMTNHYCLFGDEAHLRRNEMQWRQRRRPKRRKNNSANKSLAWVRRIQIAKLSSKEYLWEIIDSAEFKVDVMEKFVEMSLHKTTANNDMGQLSTL